MDINDIMTDGKIDGDKMKRVAIGCPYSSHDFDGLATLINAHIASLKQETPITPELLERAGFEWSENGKSYILQCNYKFIRFGSCLDINFQIGEIGKGVLSLHAPRTMENLSATWFSFSGEPLNWQHDPAAELRKRLEAMGFKSNAGNNYFIELGGIRFVVEFDSPLELSVFFGTCCQAKTSIKTIDQLEKFVGVLKGE